MWGAKYSQWKITGSWIKAFLFFQRMILIIHVLFNSREGFEYVYGEKP